MAVQEQILGLQVAVDDVVRVQVIERERNLCGVELCDGIGKALWELVSVDARNQYTTRGQENRSEEKRDDKVPETFAAG